MSKILIVDDHPILRRGLKEILTLEIEGCACHEAENAEQALERAENESWNLVILDVTMPGRSGLDVLGQIKAMRPELPVLVLSVHPEEQYGKRSLQAGASGYMNKQSAPSELTKAVRKLLAGGRYVSPALAERLAVDLNTEHERPLHELLSNRELEVLKRIGSGHTVSQIAGQLRLSVTTISTYRARILQKMGMSTTNELMHYALSNDLSGCAFEDP